MTRADAERLAEIRARAEAATEGEWRHSRVDMFSYRASDGKQNSFVYPPDPNERIAVATEKPVEDAQFIAHARADIPWLLSRLEAAVERAEKAEAAIPALTTLLIEQSDIEIALRSERAALQASLDKLAKARAIVDEQAADGGLWFIPHTAPEAYLLQELRRLHAAIEGKSPDECAVDVLAARHTGGEAEVMIRRIWCFLFHWRGHRLIDGGWHCRRCNLDWKLP